MTSEMVESTWANIGFFSPPSQPRKRLHLKIIKKRQCMVFNRTCRDNIYIYIYIHTHTLDTDGAERMNT